MTDLHQLQVIMSGRDVVVVLWYESKVAALTAAKSLMSWREATLEDDFGQTFITQRGDFGSVLVKSLSEERRVLELAQIQQ